MLRGKIAFSQIHYSQALSFRTICLRLPHYQTSSVHGAYVIQQKHAIANSLDNGKHESFYKKHVEKKIPEPTKFGELSYGDNLFLHTSDVLEVSTAIPEERDEEFIEEQDEKEDIHLRLATQDRRHTPSWYLTRIRRAFRNNKPDLAYRLFFKQMLSEDRVLPTRSIFHEVISLFGRIGNSEASYQAYIKMRQLDIDASQTTYCAVFRAFAEDLRRTLDSSRNKTTLLSGPASTHPLLTCDERKQKIERIMNLLGKLKDDRVPLSMHACNAVLWALSNVGDLQLFLRTLDEWMEFGTVGKPGPFAKLPSGTPPVPPKFKPNDRTLFLTLVAIRNAAHFFPETLIGHSKLELLLKAWHSLLPLLPDKNPSFQAVSALLRLLCQPECPAIVQASVREIEVTPRLSLAFPVPVETAAQKAELLLAEAARLPDNLSQLKLTPPDGGRHAVTLTNAGSPPASFALDLTRQDISDKQLTFSSPINLLNPSTLSHSKVILPGSLTVGQLAPWQRLALCGGLESVLRMADQCPDDPKQKFRSLFPKLISLMPPVEADLRVTELDAFERRLLQALAERDLAPDVAIFNEMISRRSRGHVASTRLLSEMSERGLYPDVITWSVLASGCATKDAVRHFLRTYRQHTKARTPSFQTFISLLYGSRRNWVARAYILEQMMLRKISPDRRLLALLERDINYYRSHMQSKQRKKKSSNDEDAGTRAAFMKFASTYRKFLATSDLKT